MKKIKRLAEWIQSSSLENRDAVIDATAQTHRYFSSIVFVVFLCYFLLISATDYALWGRWNKQHLYDFIIAGAAAVNWFVFSKPRIPRKKLLIAGDCSVLIMLILLAAGRSLGGGYVSYTLAVCTTTATIVLVLNPLHYSLFAVNIINLVARRKLHILLKGLVACLYSSILGIFRSLTLDLCLVHKFLITLAVFVAELHILLRCSENAVLTLDTELFLQELCF